ncbi:secondary thiamine-phosphate synthase enzyme YjbQ [Domibacillus sp. DTU_2020_1001157_1_SI_ALB_TIR_016]|uniref:secondary thiamine-phosphate synthase enzyme YjbQ n=1 Tax=Domibacillus sp. DTU_2020_1001157_1_SI_ALB_TIR_016 TaxID=3077789 RepID=UPI0028E49704|nr:secondary thiamine-phosphate synthase enzyme YjbQ [Domibacillus sp. DTU_2020_1001157_1_SI_ALB_TIR_016]WNS79233.1 secondary thiamine-phosphate synthase enzyme YjbQ [Domibacillus sp. DTU_2020_1001157_1_SI_ALB_TIR_016]
MVELTTLTVLTRAQTELANITSQVKNAVKDSSISNGLVAVITAHTTTGILVNEGLECVETDMEELLERLVPPHLPYAHAHFLPSYGATGSNAPAHLKSLLSGNHCLFPVADGEILLGSAQDIYLAEYDGPQSRKIYVQLIGE